MGACQSGVDKERAAKSKKLDTMIRKETRALNEEVKILLLGTVVFRALRKCGGRMGEICGRQTFVGKHSFGCVVM